MTARLLLGFPTLPAARSIPIRHWLILDGDGKPEIIVGSADDKVHVIQWDGSARFVYATGADVLGSPVADDLDGDGSLEIFFGSNDQLFYGIDSDGNDLPGWPQQVESNVQTAPVFFDFDNDGVAEIVSAERGGLLSVFSLSGERLPNFPRGNLVAGARLLHCGKCGRRWRRRDRRGNRERY